MHVGSRMSFILTIVVSTTKNIAESKERRVSAEVLVIGSYAAPDHRIAPRVWGDVLSQSKQDGRKRADSPRYFENRNAIRIRNRTWSRLFSMRGER